MQLDKTYIAIRERDLLDIFDLSLHVFRRFAFPLLMAFAAGLLPVVLFHHWLMDGFDLMALDEDAWFKEDGWYYEVMFGSVFLVTLLSPIVAEPATLYLGQAMFLERPNVKRLGRELLGSLPQLIVFQVVLRGILLIPVVTAFLPYAVWPYLNEIILLERNPMFRSRKNKISTMRRSSALHSANFGDLFGRWLAALAFATMGCSLIFLGMWLTKFWTTGNADISPLMFLVFVETSLWTTVCYFTVARFLSYLDLRIRREGWEVELRMRAEGARLSRRLAV